MRTRVRQENARLASGKTLWRVGYGRDLLIIGAGGWGALAASAASEINATAAANDFPNPWNIIGYADSDASKRGTRHEGYKVHGTLEDLTHEFQGRELCFFSAIGDNYARAKAAGIAEELGWKPATLIHPMAFLASGVEIRDGSYIGPMAVISVNTKIGAHTFIDMHVSIGHDAVLHDFCVVYPGARISGCCRVGEYALVGSNATLLPSTMVGERAVVGACSLASGAIEPDTTILGVPARVLFHKNSPGHVFVKHQPIS